MNHPLQFLILFYDFSYHLIFFVWTFMSITNNTVTPKCFPQTDSTIDFGKWACNNITLSRDNPDLQTVNTTHLRGFGFYFSQGQVDSTLLKNFTELKNFFIDVSKLDRFEFKSDSLKNFLFARTEVPQGSNFANCCIALEKLIVKSSKGLELEHEGFTGLKRLKSLYIKDQNIKHITRNTFIGLCKLKQLSLINNSIDTIQEDSFVDLVNLRELYIEDNTLKSIHQKAFEPLSHLRSLTVYGNNLEPLPLWMFKNQNKLREIGLPFKTWTDIDIEKFPMMFPELGFFSYKSGTESHGEIEYVRRKHKKLVTLLFRDKDT